MLLTSTCAFQPELLRCRRSLPNITYIENFAFHTLTNIYPGWTATVTPINPAATYTTQLNIGETYPQTISSEWSGSYAAWIDYKQRFPLDATELIYYDTMASIQTGYVLVTIPIRTLLSWGYGGCGCCVQTPLPSQPCGSYVEGDGRGLTK
jgi:hypothetical protein